MNKTEISWTDLTWNPVTGCSKVSPGCQNCYAEALYKRYHFDFTPMIHPEKLKQVKSIPAGSKVFVNSTSDLFHEDIHFSFIRDVMNAINSRPDVTFQILTKRPDNIKNFLASGHYIPGNVWLGVSVEMRQFAFRIFRLLETTSFVSNMSHVRFVSFEPLIGDIGEIDFLGMVQWIIIGGESGPNHRPFNPDWARNLIRQAKEQNVAVWMKQLGGFRPGNSMGELPEDLRIREFPETASPSNLTEAKQ